MKKKILSLFLFIVICASVLHSVEAVAYQADDHNKIYRSILFGKNFEFSSLDQERQAKLQALEAASYLTLDQYNNKGVAELKTLKNRKVRHIPKSIDAINFQGNAKHRKYTHKGWDYNYDPDTAKFSIRKDILINTVNKELSFGFFSNVGFPVNSDKCESFAAFTYYIHILGDYLYIGDPTSNKNIENRYYTKNDNDFGDMIDFVNNSDDNLVDEMNKHLKVIFKDQDNEVKKLTDELDSIKNDALEIYNDVDGSTIKGKPFDDMYAQLEKYRDTLRKYVPSMLKKEPFFSDAFN